MSFGLISASGLFPTASPAEPVKTVTPSTINKGYTEEVIELIPLIRNAGVLFKAPLGCTMFTPAACPPNS